MKTSLKFLALSAVIALAACSPEATKQTVKAYLPEEKIVEDNTQIFDPTVDILFVVDNSGSMSSHQNNLANNIALFTSTFTKNSILDYNIGVVTTDMNSTSWNGGGVDCCGKLYGNVRVVNKNTPDINRTLGRNFLVGTNGDYQEKSFDPVISALSAPLNNGWNAGFYRQNASIAVIFITDAEDQGSTSPAGFYNFLVNMKNGDKNKVLGYGVLVPTWESNRNCTRDDASEKPNKIEEFLSYVKNGAGGTNVLSLCALDYGTQLAGLAKDIVEQVGNVIYLNRMPDVTSIRVLFGSTQLPADPDYGWSFDPARNAVILGDKIDWSSQPSGSRVKVLFNAAYVEGQSK